MAQGKRSRAKVITAQERRIQALELAKGGLSHRAIATQLGVSHTTIQNDLRRGLGDLKAVESQTAEGLRIELQGRIRTLYTAIEEKVKAGDLKAGKLWIDAIDTEARIFGLSSAPPVAIQNNIVFEWPEPVAAPLVMGELADG